MEIEKNLKKKGTFADLSQGDVFVYDDDVYMVLNEDYGLGDSSSYDGYAVYLASGNIYGFNNDEECTKVSAKLTVTG